jgi:hypothetical protein
MRRGAQLGSCYGIPKMGKLGVKPLGDGLAQLRSSFSFRFATYFLFIFSFYSCFSFLFHIFLLSSFLLRFGFFSVSFSITQYFRLLIFFK